MTNLFSLFIDEHLHQYVQPIVCVKTQKLAFFEVLSRVTYNGKIYSPREFLLNISSLQRLKITRLVITNVVDLQAKYPKLTFSINITSRELSEGIDEDLKNLATRTKEGLDPSKTILEIIETTPLAQSEIEKIETLHKKYGYRFAIDDFGSGYSSINQIEKSNHLFEFVKIDGELLRGVEANRKKKKILLMLVKIIKNYNKKTVLEFVESPELICISKQVGADYVQGYVFGMPAPIKQYLKSINQNNLIVPIVHKEKQCY